MKLVISISERHFNALLILVTIIASAGFVIAITSTQAYHPLQDVAKSASDLTSVDSNSNGIIDAAELLLGTNMLPASGSAGIGTTSPAQKLHVIGKAQADDFCLNADTAKCVSNSIGDLVRYSHIKRFTEPGTETFTVPAGVDQLMIEVWGAGGGGYPGSCSYMSGGEGGYWVCTAGAGGSGGGYGKDIFDVTAGDTLTVVVGAGGVVAGIGGTSSVVKGGSALIRAAGGNNATNIGYARINVSGQSGRAGEGAGAGGNGGAGARGGIGGSGGVSWPVNGYPGSAPGGGGGGGGAPSSDSVGAGGYGAPGRVIITWGSPAAYKPNDHYLVVQSSVYSTFEFTVATANAAFLGTYKRLNDKKFDTGMITSNGNEWLEAVFSKPFNISAVTVAGGYLPSVGFIAAYLNGARLQYSTDRTAWTTVLTISGVSDAGETNFTLPTPITAQYWRLSKSGYLAATEFRFE